MKTLKQLFCLFLLVSIVTPFYALAANIKDLGASLPFSEIDQMRLNNHQDIMVAGDNNDEQYRTVVWTRDTGLTDIGDLGGGLTMGFSMNDNGDVVGASTIASGNLHAFIWNINKGMRDLGTLKGTDSIATGINNQGDVAGNMQTASGKIHAVIWQKATGTKGGHTDLGTLSKKNNVISVVMGINEQGHLLGSRFKVYNMRPSDEFGGTPFIWNKKSGAVNLKTDGLDVMVGGFKNKCVR